MTLQQLLGIELPIIQAPMAGVQDYALLILALDKQKAPLRRARPGYGALCPVQPADASCRMGRIGDGRIYRHILGAWGRAIGGSVYGERLIAAYAWV